jgi:hypothetical protein
LAAKKKLASYGLSGEANAGVYLDRMVLARPQSYHSSAPIILKHTHYPSSFLAEVDYLNQAQVLCL